MVRLLIGVPLALALTLSLGIGPAFADIDIFTTGTVGDHSLPMDTVASGGVICTYDGTGYLVGARMKPPRVYAVDKNGHRNSGRVAWRLIVDRYNPDNPGPGAQIFYTSARQVRTAWDYMPASFRGMSVKHAFPRDNSQYRFFAKMIWLRADGTQLGQSVHVVTQYKRVSPWAEEIVYGSCTGNLAYTND